MNTTSYRINTEKLHFLAREINDMDIKEANILVAIYIYLINMVNAFTNFQIDFIFSNKYEVAKRKLVVGYNSRSSRRRWLLKRCSYKFRKIQRKAPVLESLF